MPDALPDDVVRARRNQVLDVLRRNAPRGVRTGELQALLGIGEHATYVVLRDLEVSGQIATNGLQRSARRWVLTDSSAPSPDAPAAPAPLAAVAGGDSPAGARGAGLRPRSGVALRNTIAEVLDLDPTRCSDEDLVEDIREAIADRVEAEAEAAALRDEVVDLREALSITHTTLDGLGVPNTPWTGRASTRAAWRLGSLALRTTA